MRLAITGHRPDKLVQGYNRTFDAVLAAYDTLSPEYIYEGQAAGADLIAAKAAAWRQIPFSAVVPWATHHRSIPDDWRTEYGIALDFAHYVEILSDSETYPGPWVYFNRNHYMVDHADEVLAIFDGNFGRGGTQETVSYAIRKKKPVHVIHPVTLEFTRNAY